MLMTNEEIYLESPRTQVFGIVIVCQRGEMIVWQVGNSPRLEENRIEKEVEDEGEERCSLFWRWGRRRVL